MLYCLTHGRAHYPGENENVDLLGDDLDCIEEEWPVVEGQVLGSHWEPTEEELYFLLTPGMLAYLETVSAGMVPVKILDVDYSPATEWVPQATLKVTAARPGFTRGQEVIVHAPNPVVVGRAQVYVSGGEMFALGPHRFVTPDGEAL